MHTKSIFIIHRVCIYKFVHFLIVSVSPAACIASPFIGVQGQKGNTCEPLNLHKHFQLRLDETKLLCLVSARAVSKDPFPCLWFGVSSIVVFSLEDSFSVLKGSQE